MNNKHPTDKILLPAVFVAGFSIMGVEITASRLLAPYFGSSLFIWTNIIGVVMVALSLGYYYGGKIADRNPDFNILLILFLAAGSIFLLIPFITKPLSSLVLSQLLALDSGSIILFTSSLFVTTILFAFPLFLLAMTSPFVIRLSEIKKTNAGTTSGKVFAVSTIGSIIGTFLPTLWMIPTLGTRITIFTFAAILIVISLLGLVRNKVYLLGLAVLLLPVVVLAKQNIKPSPNLIAEDESAYQYIQIIKEDGARYMRYNEGGGVQSIYDKDKIMTGYYYDYYNLLPYLFPEEKRKDIAVIGLAGGTISRQMNHFFDNIHIDGVEIDPEVIRMAKKYMGLNPDNVDLHKRDGRMFLKFTDNKYDIIIVDAYSNEMYIPWTMTTKEFWGLTKNRLKEDGVASINVSSVSKDSNLLSAIKNTMSSVFSEVYIYHISPGSTNSMIIAGDDLDLDKIDSNKVNKKLKNKATSLRLQARKVEYKPDEMMLMDDRAPVEFLTDKMFLDYVLESH